MNGETRTFVPNGLAVEQLVAALGAARFELGRFRPVQRTLLDTFDGRLHRAGVRVEVRTGAGTELVVRGPGPVSARVQVERVPSTAADLPRGPLRNRLAPLLDVRALLPKVEVSSVEARGARRSAEGKAVVAVVLHDELQLPSGGSPPVRWAVELHPLAGYPKAARQTAALLGRLGMTVHNGSALELAAEHADIDLGGFTGSASVPLDRSEPALDGFRRVLANLAGTMDANWQGTVDDVDPEFLHDLRVAARRTRSLLAHGKQVLPRDGRDHFRAEFRWLGEVTGPARDLDVYVIEWPGYIAPLDPRSAAALAPVLELIDRRQRAAHVTLAGDLRSARYHGLMTGWRAWLDAPVAPAELDKRSTKPLGQAVSARLGDAQNRLLARGRSIGTDTASEELHELRKDAKRLRYLLECFAGVLPAATRKSFVQRLKSLQDNLGEHQDTEVHSSQLRSLSEEVHGAPGATAETLLAMGRLTELFDQRRQAARQEFATRFASYDTKETARLFDDMRKRLSAG
ncbi:MAG: CHAD domain-containing protein [Acidimicrobiales bacterium]